MTTVWLDGELLENENAKVAPFTHALHYGSGVFEGIRAYPTRSGSGVFRLEDHLRRLFVSAGVYGLRIPYTVEALATAVHDTLHANGFTEGYIRPLAFFGERGISLAPRFSCPTRVLIALKPLTGSLVGNAPGARVTISPWQKTSSRSMPSTVKGCGHYTNSILALQEAYERGFDEAILLNAAGHVSEGTGENIFIVRDGRLITNDASADVLMGITRDTVMTLARDRNLSIEIRDLDLSDLFEADEVFLTGTAAEVMPVAEIDGTRFPAPGPIAAILQAAYRKAVVGEDPRHYDWVSVATEPPAPSLRALLSDETASARSA
jgi:branched-chain amino acid aminotransferase